MKKNIPVKTQVRQLKERVHQLETCYKITSLLNSELNLAKLLETIMTLAKKVMRADASSLLLLENENTELVFQIALSDVADKLLALDPLKMGKGISGTVAQTGRPLIVKDAYAHPKFNPRYDEVTGFHTGSILCAPLKAKGKVIGVCEVIHSRKKRKGFTPGDLELFRLFCDSAGLALQNAQMHRILLENQRHEKDMEFARSVQQSFLPDSLPEEQEFLFGARTWPARTVAGDYYDFIPLGPHSLGIVLGDVSGKGVPAALQMARLMSDFRYISRVDPQPAQVLYEINNILYERSHRGMFSTAVFLLLDLKTKTLHAANAGHPPLLVRSRRQKVELKVPAGGMPLGILPNVRFEQETLTLKNGDSVLIYSDGVVEPRNPKNEQFGLRRLREFFRKEPGPPEETLLRLQKSIHRFRGHGTPYDDLTCVLFQIR